MAACSCTRREFVLNGIKAVALLGVVSPALIPGVAHGQDAKAAPKTMTIDLTQKANTPLTKTGGAIFVKNPNNEKESIILVRSTDVEVVALVNYCPHKGGPLEEKKGQFVCEWHGAAFDKAGKVVKGPAKTNLKSYAAKVEGTTVTITL